MIFSFYYPCYIPGLQDLANLLDSELILFTDQFQFVKRSSLTRAKLFSSDPFLTLPVQHTGRIVSIMEKRLIASHEWKKKHLHRIYHHYHNLPYFDYYFPNFKDIYLDESVFLSEFLFRLLQFYLSSYKISGHPKRVSTLFHPGLSLSEILVMGKEKYQLYQYGHISDNAELTDVLHFNNLGFLRERPLVKKFPFQLNPLEFLFTFGAEAAFLLRS